MSRQGIRWQAVQASGLHTAPFLQTRCDGARRAAKAMRATAASGRRPAGRAVRSGGHQLGRLAHMGQKAGHGGLHLGRVGQVRRVAGARNLQPLGVGQLARQGLGA